MPGVRAAKHQVKNENVNPTVTYCGGTSKNLSYRSSPLPDSCPTECWTDRTNMNVGLGSLLRKPPTAGNDMFIDLWAGRRVRSTRGSRALSTVRAGNMFSRFPHLSPQGDLSKTICGGPHHKTQMKRSTDISGNAVLP